ncbi:MAG: hypothetical protein EOO17_03640 [Chloroflexi bacterium]|nr:MAG: hypothetical protein EOO17_03640 [Chloroflexota bacterium]
MINLLPESQKKELKAARTNVTLLRYNIFMIVGLALLTLMCGLFFVILLENKRVATVNNADNVEKAKGYNDVKKSADEYKANLATAKKILDNEVTYTDTVFAIAGAMPRGVVLDSLSLSAQDFGSQVSLTAKARDIATATKLKQQFQTSKVFSNVYFQTITKETTEGQASAYPIAVNISVKINKAEQ